MMIVDQPNWRGRLTLPQGEDWAVLAELMEGLMHRAYDVRITVRDGRAIVRGKVFSENVKLSIQRIVALYAPTTGVDNELEFASPLYSADDGETDVEFNWATTLQAPLPGQERVDRHPKVKSIGEAELGRRLDLMVDLTIERDSYSTGSFAINTNVGWTELKIDVVVTCEGLDMPAAQRRKTMALLADGASIPALFSGVVTGEKEVVFRINFTHEGIDCGYAEHTVPVRSPISTVAAQSSSVSNYMTINPIQDAPHLTVRIIETGTKGVCQWTFEVRPDLRDRVAADAFGSNDLGDTAISYFQRQFAECPQLTPGRHIERLRGLGERIWRAAPVEFRELYVAIREFSGPGFPIQLITNEPYVPWEMMFPDDHRVRDPAHLFCEHPIARWFMKSGPRLLNFDQGRRVSFVPTYAGNSALPATTDELKWLVATLGAETGDASYDGFSKFLRQPQARVQLVHYAGHGAAPGNGLHGLWLGGGDWYTEDEINSSVILGRDHRPFFALNACQVGQTSTALGSVAGWPMAVTSRGFGGVMAPLWSVEDTSASLFVQSFLKAFMVEGQRLGEAAKIARMEHAAASSDAHAYLFYGDVMAQAVP